TRVALDNARTWLPTSLYPDALAWLHRERQYCDRIYPFPFPSTYNELYRYSPLDEVKSAKELAWCVALLSLHLDKISKYVMLRTALEEAMLQGNAAGIHTALDSIENELGVSFWLIAIRTAAIQMTQGLEAQKKFSNAVRKTITQKGVTAWVAYKTSVRNEPSVTPARFVVTAEQEIRGLKTLPESWK